MIEEIFQDPLLSSAKTIFDDFEDSIFSLNFNDIDVSCDPDLIFSCLDMCPTSASIDQFSSSSSFEVPQTIPTALPTLSNYVEHEQNVIAKSSSCLDLKQFGITLSFINPPEPVYHVRYLSEITDLPIDGNYVNTKNITKKNLSGRYVKGIRGRHVTITLPAILSDNSNLYIRVTRLTVPYQDVSFVHPYPLLYSCTKQKKDADVIIKGSSFYFKIVKEEICSRLKQFPYMILTRLKQCHLKKINNLCAFDNNEILYPFDGSNAKNKIALYQLKKSQLDFRLVVRCEQSGEFLDTNVFCRSSPLLEEEGIYSKKSSL